MEENRYIEIYKTYYNLKDKEINQKNIEQILNNFCYLQDLINININGLADFFGNLLKNKKKSNPNINQNNKSKLDKNFFQIEKKNFKKNYLKEEENKLKEKRFSESEKKNNNNYELKNEDILSEENSKFSRNFNFSKFINKKRIFFENRIFDKEDISLVNVELEEYEISDEEEENNFKKTKKFDQRKKFEFKINEK